MTAPKNKKCASGSVVEHLLAKERVAGSIPVSRLHGRYPVWVSFFVISVDAYNNYQINIVNNKNGFYDIRCNY